MVLEVFFYCCRREALSEESWLVRTPYCLQVANLEYPLFGPVVEVAKKNQVWVPFSKEIRFSSCYRPASVVFEPLT